MTPGEHLAEYMAHYKLNARNLARLSGMPVEILHGILAERLSITESTAEAIEPILGMPAHFWMNLETNYQQRKDRQWYHR